MAARKTKPKTPHNVFKQAEQLADAISRLEHRIVDIDDCRANDETASRRELRAELLRLFDELVRITHCDDGRYHAEIDGRTLQFTSPHVVRLVTLSHLSFNLFVLSMLDEEEVAARVKRYRMKVPTRAYLVGDSVHLAEDLTKHGHVIRRMLQREKDTRYWIYFVRFDDESGVNDDYFREDELTPSAATVLARPYREPQ